MNTNMLCKWHVCWIRYFNGLDGLLYLVELLKSYLSACVECQRGQFKRKYDIRRHCPWSDDTYFYVTDNEKDDEKCNKNQELLATRIRQVAYTQPNLVILSFEAQIKKTRIDTTVSIQLKATQAKNEHWNKQAEKKLNTRWKTKLVATNIRYKLVATNMNLSWPGHIFRQSSTSTELLLHTWGLLTWTAITQRLCHLIFENWEKVVKLSWKIPLQFEYGADQGLGGLLSDG